MNQIIKMLAEIASLPPHLRTHAIQDVRERVKEVRDSEIEQAKYDGFKRVGTGWKMTPESKFAR